jgi:hypothetical protein
MVLHVILVVGVLVVVFVGVSVLVHSLITTSTEAKGPMPKNHGGFGQSVHGGKS